MTTKVSTTSDASVAYARDLTDRIRGTAEGLYALLLEAWESEAWRHLGYRSWNQYIAGEFDFSRQRAYQLVNQGAVIREIKAGMSTTVDTREEIHVTEREARDIKPIVPEVVAEVREQVAAGVPAQEAVRSAVESHRPPTVTRTRLYESSVHEQTDGFDDEFPVRTVADTCVHEWVCRHCGELQG